MEQLSTKEMLDAGVHYGHLKKKWNPKMLPYIFKEIKGIHIIDLNKTNEKLQESAFALKNIARSGKKILFVATKKQAKGIVEEAAKKVNMPFVTERWLGGMLTNFATIRKSIKKMQTIDKMLSDGSGSYESITKKERLVLSREREKLERVIGGIAQLNRIPAAIFVVDISHEHIAISEAHKLNMTTFAMVDTNSDPNMVDFAIPANDDASKSVELIVNYITGSIIEGLEERKKEKVDIESAKTDKKTKEKKVAKPIETIEMEASDEDGSDNKREEKKSKPAANKGPVKRPARKVKR